MQIATRHSRAQRSCQKHGKIIQESGAGVIIRPPSRGVPNATPVSEAPVEESTRNFRSCSASSGQKARSEAHNARNSIRARQIRERPRCMRGVFGLSRSSHIVEPRPCEPDIEKSDLSMTSMSYLRASCVLQRRTFVCVLFHGSFIC